MDRRHPPADRREPAPKRPQSRDELARIVASLHQAMAALAHSEQQLKAAERLAHVGSWQWDETTSVGTWSDELFRIFGISGRPPSGFGEFIRLIHPDDQAQVKSAVATGYAERRPFELSFRSPRPPVTAGRSTWC